MTYETYRYIFSIAGILCIVMFVVSVILFIVLRVPQLIGDLSGSAARKAIQDIREKNEQSGDKTYRTSTVNRNRGKLTDKISPSGKIQATTQSPLATGVITTKIATQNLQQTAEETTVLQPSAEAENMIGEGAGETTVLTSEETAVKDFEIEVDITYVHTNEIVRDEKEMK